MTIRSEVDRIGGQGSLTQPSRAGKSLHIIINTTKGK